MARAKTAFSYICNIEDSTVKPGQTPPSLFLGRVVDLRVVDRFIITAGVLFVMQTNTILTKIEQKEINSYIFLSIQF